MPAALLLTLAIVSEVVGTLALKQADGLQRPGWLAVTVVAYLLTFALLGAALRELQVGVAYAIWAAAGTALVAIAGAVLFDEPLGALKVMSIGLIVLGVVGLNLAGTQH